MAFMLDTDVAIRLRDADPTVTEKVAALDGAVLMSIVTRVELEGGVYREPLHASVRRARLDAILAAVPTVAFDDAAADAYRAIVESAGYSRRKLLDRMIAAQALVHRASLVTKNAGDYADIPDLSLLAW
jgi:tRNA(fMet)-specific endonuclease VapC